MHPMASRVYGPIALSIKEMPDAITPLVGVLKGNMFGRNSLIEGKNGIGWDPN